MLSENVLALFCEPALFRFFGFRINLIAPFAIWLDLSLNCWLLLLNLVEL